MKRIITLLAIVCSLTAITLACCGNDESHQRHFAATQSEEPIRSTETNGITTFIFPCYEYSALEVSSIFHVAMCDTVDSIRVFVSNELVDKLEVRINKETLIIGLNNATFKRTKKEPIARVLLPYNLKLSAVTLSGAADFHTALPIRGNTFRINQSGASSLKADYIQASKINLELSGASTCRSDLRGTSIDLTASGASNYLGNMRCKEGTLSLSGASGIKGNIETPALELALSGATNTRLAGKADEVELRLSGTAELKGGDLSTRVMTGKMSGASNAKVNCTERIAIELSGTSNLKYTGNAENHCTASKMANVSRF